MTRLVEGARAPHFDTVDSFGEPVSLAALRGRKVMLSFYRYAACPLCNMRVNAMTRRHAEWAAQGLELLAVFQSSAEEIGRYVGRQDAPFPIIPDAPMTHYRRFGVEKSWGGFFMASLKLDVVIKAIMRGYFPTSFSGPLNRLPADFLIDENGRLVRCYYGTDAADHLPVEEIDAFAASQGASRLIAV